MILRPDSKIFNLFLTAEEAAADYPKTTTTAAHVHQSDASIDVFSDNLDHPVLIIVEVTEAFANGSGAQPTFKIGQTGTAEKFLASASLTDAALGARFVVGGTLTHADDLLVTATVATGTATGAIRVTSVALRDR